MVIECARNVEQIDEDEEKQEPDQDDILSAKWRKPTSGTTSGFAVVKQMLSKGISARQLLQSLLASECSVPTNISDPLALRLLLELVEQRPYRQRLPEYHSFQHAVQLLK